jgi:hypothetical protein
VTDRGSATGGNLEIYRFYWQAVPLYAKKQASAAFTSREQVKFYSILSIKKVGKYVRTVGKG